jgi:hypothetical protein
MIYITLHRNIKIEQHEPHSKPDVNSGPLRKVKQFPLHMLQPSCYFLLQTPWRVMNVKNSSNVIKTTLQPSHYNLISWRLVNAIVITWLLLDTTWVWNVDIGLVLEWWRCKKKIWIASESILLSKRTLPWSSVCSMHNGLFILITQLKKNRQERISLKNVLALKRAVCCNWATGSQHHWWNMWLFNC